MKDENEYNIIEIINIQLRRVLMKRLLIATLLGCLLLVGCGSNENEVVENTSEVVEDITTLESETIEDISTMENENETNEETSTMENESETIEDTTTMESETIEEPTPIEEVAPTYTFVDMDTRMYAKQSVNVRDIPSSDGNKLGGLTTNQEVIVNGQCNETSWYRIEYNGSVGYVSNNYLVSEKIEEPTPTPSATPSESASNVDYGNGDDLSFSGSLTLPSGLTIKTLNKFNACAMDTRSGNSWMGDIYSNIVAQNYETMANNFDAFNAMYNDSVINVTNGEQIWWRSSMANSGAAIELRRCGDHYKIIISSPLLHDATAEALGWMSGREDEAREALVVLLSTITPNCVEVKDLIIDSLFNINCAIGEEPIKEDGTWCNTSDCRIRLGAWDTTNGNFIFVFEIEPN